MQAPVQHAGDHCVARQARAVQEEEKADGDIRRDGEPVCPGAVNGKEGCEDHGSQQHHRI
ncbi:hypothetical protein D3C78_1791840 [compost metagenome]